MTGAKTDPRAVVAFGDEELSALIEAVALKKDLLLRPDLGGADPNAAGKRYALYCNLYEALADVRRHARTLPGWPPKGIAE